MKLDLRPMLRGEISRMGVDFSLAQIDELDDVRVSNEIAVKGEIVDTAGYMRMTLTVGFDYSGECARCLSAVEGRFETEFARTVVDEGTLTDEQLEDNVDEYVIIRDGFLDVDEELCEAVIFDFPSKLLCSEDCPGLCLRCGKPKRDGECGCNNIEPDQRWAVLKNFFDEEK